MAVGMLFVTVVAVDDVGGYELVQQPGYNLDSDEACDEAARHNKASRLLADPTLNKVLLGSRQHIKQRRKYLGGTVNAGYAGARHDRIIDAQLTMTPKLRLRAHVRKALLSWMRKFFWPGMHRTKISMHMMLDPTTQAAGGTERLVQQQVSPGDAWIKGHKEGGRQH